LAAAAAAVVIVAVVAVVVNGSETTVAIVFVLAALFIPIRRPVVVAFHRRELLVFASIRLVPRNLSWDQQIH
jgi:hypothetical protein